MLFLILGAVLVSLRHLIKYVMIFFEKNESNSEIQKGLHYYPKLSTIVSFLRAITMLIVAPFLLYLRKEKFYGRGSYQIHKFTDFFAINKDGQSIFLFL